MKNIILFITAVFFCCLFKQSAPAKEGDPVLLEAYAACLSADDHRNSSGVKLTDVAAILRQDRANYHTFNKRDEEDLTDPYLDSEGQRERIADVQISDGAKTAVLSGTPLVLVKIYGVGDTFLLKVKVIRPIAASPKKEQNRIDYKGTFKGNPCEVSVYYYRRNDIDGAITLDSDGAKYEFEGSTLGREGYMEIEIQGEPVPYKLTRDHSAGHENWFGGPGENLKFRRALNRQ